MAGSLGDVPLLDIKATLYAYITSWDDYLQVPSSKTRLLWELTIEANIDGGEHEGVSYPEPVGFYYERLSFPEPLRHWMDLSGQSFEWNRSNTDVFSVDVNGFGNSWPRFYLWGHHTIERGVIRVLERDGCSFRIHWDGWNDGYGEFSIDQWVPFEGVRMPDKETVDAKALDVLARHLEPSDFLQHTEVCPERSVLLFKPKRSEGANISK